MKFKIKKSDIINVLSKVQGITGRKTNLAITTNILISTAGTGIRISATDLETGFEGFYPAEIETEGSIAINARKIYEIVREFPSEEINFNEVENNWIEIRNEFDQSFIFKLIIHPNCAEILGEIVPDDALDEAFVFEHSNAVLFLKIAYPLQYGPVYHPARAHKVSNRIRWHLAPHAHLWVVV